MLPTMSMFLKLLRSLLTPILGTRQSEYESYSSRLIWNITRVFSLTLYPIILPQSRVTGWGHRLNFAKC